MKNHPMYERAVTILRRTPFAELRREYGSLNAAWAAATELLREAERFGDARAVRLGLEYVSRHLLKARAPETRPQKAPQVGAQIVQAAELDTERGRGTLEATTVGERMSAVPQSEVIQIINEINDDVSLSEFDVARYRRRLRQIIKTTNDSLIAGVARLCVAKLARRTGEPDVAAEELRKAKPILRGSDFYSSLVVAEIACLLDMDDAPAALRVHEEALNELGDAHRSNFVATANIAEAWDRLGEHQKAAVILEELVQRSAKDGPVLLRLANQFAAIAESRRSVTLLARALGHDDIQLSDFVVDHLDDALEAIRDTNLPSLIRLLRRLALISPTMRRRTLTALPPHTSSDDAIKMLEDTKIIRASANALSFR